MVAETVIEFHAGPAIWVPLLAAAVSVIGTAVALHLGLSSRRDQRRDQHLSLRRQSLDPVMDWLADGDVALTRLNYEIGVSASESVVDEAAEVARAHSLNFRRMVSRVSLVLGEQHPLVPHLREAHRAYGDIVRQQSVDPRHLGPGHSDVIAWAAALEGASLEIASECGYPQPVLEEAEVWRVVRDARAAATATDIEGTDGRI